MLKRLMREESRFAFIGRPHDWQTLSAPPSMDLIVAAPERSGHFRPNAVVNSFPYSGSIAKLCTVVLAYARTSMKDIFFISVDELFTDSGIGRIIEYTYSAGDNPVHCKVVVLQTTNHAVLVTASCAASELSAYDEILELVCTSVQLKEES